MRVLVLLSGGVDSAVAAYLLKKQGHEVSGMFMKNWTPLDVQNPGDCPWQQDQDDAEAVAKHLDIPFRSVNFEKEYQRDVASYFIAEYAAGRTPNPDVLCNQKIKFGVAWQWAKEQGFDMIATGHYARIVRRAGRLYIGRGRDRAKDQSYFLAAVPNEVVSHILFPLGDLRKTRVRHIATTINLPVAQKKDSQGICFVGHLPVRTFLRESLHTTPGTVVAPDGSVIGAHDGAELYTIGQRHGFRITNAVVAATAFGTEPTKLPPLFVVAKDVKQNTVTVDGAHSAVLHPHTIEVSDVVWVGTALRRADVQIRYRTADIPVTVKDLSDGRCRLVSRRAFVAPAAGQFAVLYRKGVVVGCGHVV